MFVLFIFALILSHISARAEFLPKIEVKSRKPTDFSKKVNDLTNKFQISKPRSASQDSEFVRQFNFNSRRNIGRTKESGDQTQTADIDRQLTLTDDVGQLGIYNFAGTGVMGYTGDGGDAKSATFGYVTGVVVDNYSSFRTYIADAYYSVIRVVDNGVINTYAGDGQSRYLNDNMAATLCSMNAPQNLAVDYAGNVYVADLYNNLVRVVSYATQDMSTVAGKNPSSSCAGENSDPTTMCLNFPVGVAVDSNFNIYVAEAGGNQIKYVDVANNVMYTIIGTGAAGYTGDGGIGLSATLNQPAGLAVDLSLHLYICDNGNNVVRKFYPSGGGGTILTIIGTSAGSGYTADGADAASTQISFPYGIVVDNSANIYFTDTGNNVVRVVDASTNEVSTYAGNVINPTTYNGDHLAATAANLDSPYGITLDASGTIIFAEYNHFVVRYLSDVAPTSQPTGQPTMLPTGQPTALPTSQPSGQPSTSPTGQPSEVPSGQPSGWPTSQPSEHPSAQPSSSPTSQPSQRPTMQPTMNPTSQPSPQPTSDPTGQPTMRPTSQPSDQPSRQPTAQPTRRPTSQPSRQPSEQPTSQPSGQPTCVPTSAPTQQKEQYNTFVHDYLKRSRKNGLCDRNCSGHGLCKGNINCECFTGLTGEPMYTGPDCSLFVCPRDTAWVGSVVGANNLSPLVECSNRGVCDRETGQCNCFTGYSGIACQRSECPQHCHGRGMCLPERILASKAGHVYTTPWDSSKASGCLCDPGYRGAACEMQECPSGADPLGGFGNESGRDCSGRGICDYGVGKCNCFAGYVGTRCETVITYFV